MKVVIAYIYETSTGLVRRAIVSDDYGSEAALKVDHLAPGESAVSTVQDGSLDEKRGQFIAMSDEDMQAAVQQATGIKPPPLLRYAICGPNGKVFGVVDTRRVTDPRLGSHAAFNEMAAVSASDLNAAQAIVRAFPDLELVDEKARTPEMIAAHALIYRAKAMGFVADDVSRDPPLPARAEKLATDAKFVLYRCPDADLGDTITSDGSLCKVTRMPLVLGNSRANSEDIVL